MSAPTPPPRDPYDRIAAECALACYGHAPLPIGCDAIHSGAVNHVQFDVYGREHDGLLIVAVAGSNELRDWIRHLYVPRKRLPSWCRPPEHAGAAMHRGWLADGVSILPIVSGVIRAEMRRMRGPVTVLYTGHSYGGPMAALLALVEADARPSNVAALRTFGSPAPGNRALARYLDAAVPDHRRHASPLDPVTRVPLANAHAGQLVESRHGWPAHPMHKYLSAV